MTLIERRLDWFRQPAAPAGIDSLYPFAPDTIDKFFKDGDKVIGLLLTTFDEALNLKLAKVQQGVPATISWDDIVAAYKRVLP